MRCDFHINNGVSNVVIDAGICAGCLLRQPSLGIEKAALSFLDHYLQMKINSLSLSGPDTILKNFYTIFNIAIKIYPKEMCVNFLSNLMIELSKSPYIKESDIEEAYDKARRFEEN